MWIRRSAAEIAEIDRRKRFSPVGALVITAFVMLLVLLLQRSPTSITSPAFLLASILVFVLLYVSHITVGRYLLPLPGPTYNAPRSLNQNMICPVCLTHQLDTESHTCACGGRLEPLDHWRWVGDGKADATSTQGT
jgi:hypothetical protein